MTLPGEIAAAILGESANFVTIGTDGFSKVNVRTTAKTVDTDELLYVTYVGHLEASDSLWPLLKPQVQREGQ